ncbi:MAG: hypothetical protein J6A53_04065, partial [Clostridia bacterium]|nr:hypothetical protein [Clostridia bacterium]
QYFRRFSTFLRAYQKIIFLHEFSTNLHLTELVFDYFFSGFEPSPVSKLRRDSQKRGTSLGDRV